MQFLSYKNFNKKICGIETRGNIVLNILLPAFIIWDHNKTHS